jgi:hypothetical protein
MKHIFRTLVCFFVCWPLLAHSQTLNWAGNPQGPFGHNQPFRFIPDLDGKEQNLFANVPYEHQDFGYYFYSIDGFTGQ